MKCSDKTIKKTKQVLSFFSHYNNRFQIFSFEKCKPRKHTLPYILKMEYKSIHKVLGFYQAKIKEEENAFRGKHPLSTYLVHYTLQIGY